MSIRQIIRDRMAELLNEARVAHEKDDEATAVEMYLRHDECKVIFKRIRNGK